MSAHDSIDDGDGIAVIGLAGRFPGAPTVEAFWDNLRRGVESIRVFTQEELAASGVPEDERNAPGYVPAKPVLDDIAGFDAGYFGMSPREAALIDPQQRLFLEICVELLERAALGPGDRRERVAVYGGVSKNTYLMNNLLTHPELRRSPGALQVLGGNEKDYLATRVSHKLGLRGPSLTVQTACSSALVGVHMACQSLLSGESDYAIAGGVAVDVPHQAGYMYEPGGIFSPDGHCRAFDADARGTVFGQGAGAVLLQRLSDALDDGADVHAVIRGSAINNDGGQKAGFTAPSVEGQSAVIVEALVNAGVDPATVGYVEAHGTGTPLGDPIEVEALTRAFRLWTDRSGYCRIGSVKTNIGHLNAASGIAGLIKAVLAMRHREIPPSLHFTRPNPQIPFERTPFRVAGELTPWTAADGEPLRAGVSAFGIGGTNAHLVLESAPAQHPSPPAEGWQILPLSARTPAALADLARNVGRSLTERPDLELADVAHTLQSGRQRFARRAAVVARSLPEAARAVAEAAVRQPAAPDSRPSLVFVFPGQGVQYPELARELYAQEPVFRRELDECGQLLRGLGAADPRELLRADTSGTPALDVQRTEVAQPLLFSVEFALARLWASWGVQPDAVAGHSLGELTAAAVAGVLTRDDALRLVAERSRLTGRAPAGAMLAVACAVEDLPDPLPDGVETAAVNSAAQCVLTGPQPRIADAERRLAERGVRHRRMPGGYAFHSAAMRQAADELAVFARGLEPRPARIPIASNLTGDWLTEDEARSPAYWGRQLRHTVRFAECAGKLLTGPDRVFLEVGPGQTLSSFVRRHPSWSPARHRVAGPSLPDHRARPGGDDGEVVRRALGALWEAGVEPDWQALHPVRRRPVVLPTYPFERSRHWIEPLAHAPVTTADGPLPERRAPSAPQTTAPAAAAASEPARVRSVMEVFAAVLGVQGVEPHDDFFALGGQSLLGVELVARIQEATGVQLPLTAIFDKPTPAAVAELIENAERDGLEETLAGVGADSAQDVAIEDGLTPLAPRRDPDRPRAVLLTGASGFLGVFLLHELLRQTSAAVECLVRCADAAEGIERLADGLKRYGLLGSTDLSRVRVLPGDISQDRFGLPADEYRRVAGTVDAVYHNGAKVSFLEPYRLIRRTNVKAAREALRLCAEERLKPLHHVSTIAVFDCDSVTEAIVGEDHDLTAGRGFHGGYDESKWVAEQILGRARRRGFPVTIYRPGNIAGHSETGAVSDGHLVSAMIKGCVALGLAPDTDAYVDVVPVDYVSRALVHLSLRQSAEGSNFNLVNPAWVRWRQIADQLVRAGYPMRLVPLGEWREAIRARGDDGNPMRVFLPMLDERSLFSGRRYRSERTLAELAGSGITCPPLDDRLTATYIRGLVAAGELTPPAPGGTS